MEKNSAQEHNLNFPLVTDSLLIEIGWVFEEKIRASFSDIWRRENIWHLRNQQKQRVDQFSHVVT